jgi:hypothetical protein
MKMSMEVEDIVVTGENTADGEVLVLAVVNCRACESVIEL